MDALRAAHRMGTVTARREGIERIATALERRGDLIALNEHLFDSMWTYWRTGHFTDCVACCDRATALAGRLGIPPVQYGTIKSFALVDLGHFDQAWQALEQEVADDGHPFGQAFQHLGRTWWHAASGDVERVIRDAPRIFADARKLKRTWMIPWAEGLLASAIVASHPEGTDEATMRVAVEAAGGRLTGESLVAAQLHAGNADAALKECERILSQLEAEGQVRAHWIMEELRIRALFALDRFADASDAAVAALTIVAPLGWQWLAWQLRASFVAALDALGDERLATERRSAVEVLMAVAGSLERRICPRPLPGAARSRPTC